jgi:hypothetical protein
MISFAEHSLNLLVAASVLLNLFFLCRLQRRARVRKAEPRSPVGGSTNKALHTREYFYVGGTYIPHGSSTVHHGQMYVEHLIPAQVTRRIPVLFIHGNGMTGTNWLNTPDGRPGWSDYFLNEGYEVKSPPTGGKGSHADDSFRCTLSINPLEGALRGSLKLMARPVPSLHGRWNHDLRPRQSMIFGRRLPCTRSGPEVGPRATRLSTPSIVLSFLVSLPQLKFRSS